MKIFLVTLILPLVSGETSTPNTGDQVQSFLFGFTNSHLIIPITSSCPSPLTLTSLTPTNAKTSDPKAPYTMITLVHEQLIDGNGIQYERLYSASLDVGDMGKSREIKHPWMNGTQFIACIWGSNGASGGCQDLMTVVPSEQTFEAYSSPNSTCRTSNVLESWVPPVNETLDVEVLGASGDVSWNAWPAACSDLQINPKNGTPPYTLLVAPAAHPPVNITTSTLPINYTVRLTHGHSFMLGLYDSSGNSWAFGPLHAGESDDLSCLAIATGQQAPAKETKIGISALAGGVTGAFVLGALGAAGLMWFLLGGKKRVRKSSSQDNLYSNPRPASFSTPTNSFTGKPLSPHTSLGITPYTDSPRMEYEFDTPATLYDPHVIGPNPQNYPKPPGNDMTHNQHFSVSSRDRVSPRPPLAAAGSSSHSNTESYSNPYEVNDGYRDNISLGELRTQGDRRSSMTSLQQQQQQQQPITPGGHVQEPSWTSSNGSPNINNRNSSGVQGRIQASSSLSIHNSPNNLNQIPIPNPSSPRPGSFGSTHHSPSQNNHHINNNNNNEEPASPSSLRGPGLGPGPRNVYVVHSDGGNGDLHIQLPDSNSRVIELPPDYRHETNPNIPNVENNNNHSASPQHSPGLPITSTPPPGGTPYLGVEPTRSRVSGLSMNGNGGAGGVNSNEMTVEELRARAEARLREKMRGQS